MSVSIDQARPRGRSLGKPFGTPEGANANLQELLANFIEFGERGPDDALAAEAQDHSTRIVVGKMGVGKTVYLRRFQATAKNDEALYVDDVQYDGLPPTEDVIYASQQFKTEVVEEMWEAVWRRAIVRSAVSHILHHKSLRDREEAVELAEQATNYSELLPVVGAPRSPYTELADILVEYPTREKLRRYGRSPRWAELEWHLAEALKGLPPLCFYLDAADRYFSNAPMFWLGCQKGLAAAVLTLLQQGSGLRRMHVVIAIRDLVYSSMLRDDHAGKYRNEPHIRVLDWDHVAIRYFLHEKARRLPEHYRLKPDASDALEAWLGRGVVFNEGRRTSERLEDYLLRHTRLIPRDVVDLGNLLAHATSEAKERGLSELPEEAIRDVVNVAARGFADQQLEVCASQIAADQIPEHGSRQGLGSYFVGNDVYRTQMSDLLRQLITEAEFDRVTMSELQKATKVMAEKIAAHEHVLDVLWQNGMLGYDENGADTAPTHFYTKVDDFKLPTGKSTYVFHPCLGHGGYLKPRGAPVRGFSTRER
jgi:hypothetical protein